VQRQEDAQLGAANRSRDMKRDNLVTDEIDAVLKTCWNRRSARLALVCLKTNVSAENEENVDEGRTDNVALVPSLRLLVVAALVNLREL